MNIYFLIIVILVLLKVKFHAKDFNKEYLSKNNTSCIKGVFILIVFYSHLRTYMPYQASKDFIMMEIVNFLGQLMVTLFLFYSGYGVYESIKKKKNKYIKTIPKKRILRTLINFDIAVLSFALINYIMGYGNSLKDILLSLIGWESIGNSNWYIFGIIGLYLLTYISFQLFDKDDQKAIFTTWITTLIFMLFLKIYKNGATYWFNTLLCYPLGMTYSYYKKQIENLIFNNKKYIITIIITIVSFLILKNSISINYNYYYLMTFAFTLFVILITMKFNINNKVLKWFGDNLFWVYILQRIPMMILSRIGYASTHSYRFAVISFVVTIVLTLLYKTITDLIFTKFFSKNDERSEC